MDTTKKLLAAAATALALVSCSKEAEVSQDPQVVPDAPAEGYVRIAFTAAHEQTGTKTELSGDGTTKTVNWVEDDEIDVFWSGGQTTSKALRGGPTTEFTADVPGSAEPLYAVYPSGIASLSGASLTVTVPASQDGRFATGNVAVARTTLAAHDFHFFNVTSFFRVEITDPDITSFTLKAVGGEALAGVETVAFTEDGVSVGDPGETSSEITVENISGTGGYYAAVLPGMTYSKGLLVKFYKDGRSAGGYYYDRAGLELQRSRIADFGALDRRVGRYYVTVDGAGAKTGKDWANAYSAEQMFTVLSAEPDDAVAEARVAALDGSTFYLSGETFPFAAPVTFSFPSTCSVQWAGQEGTTFSGGGSSRLFTVGENAELTFDHILFTKGLGRTIMINEDTAKATFNDCDFKDNTSNDTANNGSTIHYSKGKTLELDHCNFSGNTGRGGVALTVSGQGTQVVITDCNFTDNTSTNDGSAIWIGAGSTVSMTGGSITGNSTGNANAGAFYAQESTVTLKGVAIRSNSGAKAGGFAACRGTVLLMEDCTVMDNAAKTNAGVAYFYGAADVTIQGGTFSGNTSVAHGGVFALSGSSTLRAAGATFSGNTADTGHTGSYYGGVFYPFGSKDNSDASKIYCDGCSFTGNEAGRGGTLHTFYEDGGAVYFNACAFIGNHIVGIWGAEMGFKSGNGVDWGMNNCTVTGAYTTNAKAAAASSTWYDVTACKKATLANTSIIGVPKGNDTEYPAPGFLRFNTSSSQVRLYNDIIASTAEGTGGSIEGGTSNANVPVTGDYNRMSPIREESGKTAALVYTPGGHDNLAVYGTADYFPGLALDGTCWSWIPVSTTDFGATADINQAIQEADPAFHAWLDSIGALGKDQRGISRGSISWPGAYQQNN